MHRFTLPAAVLAALAMAAPAAAAPDGTATVTAAEPTQSLKGPVANGANISYFLDGTATTGECGKDVDNYCATFLFKADEFVPTGGSKNNPSSTVTFRLDGFLATSDFDLRVYDSDATGRKGSKIGSPQSDVTQSSPLGDLDPRATGPGDYETTPVSGVRPGKYYLIEIPYFFVINDQPTVTATLSKADPLPDPEPAPER